jgi:hypothetical protein
MGAGRFEAVEESRAVESRVGAATVAAFNPVEVLFLAQASHRLAGSGLDLYLGGHAGRLPDFKYLNQAGTIGGMCRNIRTLHNFDPPASDEEIRSAALQYVRKISGYTKPSQANSEAFEEAIDDVAAISTKLLDRLVTSAPPKDREVEAAKRRARAEQRFAA